MISGVTRTAGVIGAPVTHSLSPLLMNSWIAAAGLDAVYVALPARADFDTDGFRSLGRSGLAGVNVTLPFKSRALEAADQVSEAARLVGAANLLCFGPEGIRADNTDIDGAREALKTAECEFRDRTVLVLGAGGVAQAICAAAMQDRAGRILIANRTADRASALAAKFDTAHSVDWAARTAVLAEADIVVNATSLGLDGRSSPLESWQGAREGAVAFDTVYTPAVRPFLQDARAAGLTSVDGLAMLIGQARPSFRQLFDQAAPEEIDADTLLRKALTDGPV
ncbi:shikimate dehydrogenase family protein [Hyphobacterium sp.]|uniref:shikimate dehydrogenase family protein n=1 Tax=Hyphobacterium sp. TaxID=2004662 RepID=UPI003B52DB55